MDETGQRRNRTNRRDGSEPGSLRLDARAPTASSHGHQHVAPQDPSREATRAGDLSVAVLGPCHLCRLGLEYMVESLGHVVVEDVGDADVALIDLSREGASFPSPPSAIPAIALVHEQDADLEAILRGGYRGYVRSEVDPSVLRRALEAVAMGDVWSERSVLLSITRAPDPSEPTAREREVLALLEDGLSNRAISERLGISVSTTKAHVTSLLRKLEAESRLALVTKRRHA